MRNCAIHISFLFAACLAMGRASAQKQGTTVRDSIPHSDTGKLRAPKPQEIVFLLDVSNSMAQGKKMELLRGSMLVLLEKLRPVDRVSLISFGNDVNLLYRTTTFSKPDSLMRIIGMVRSKATATNVNGAIDMAYEQMSATPHGSTQQEVFLVTDGEFELSKRIIALVKKDSTIRLTAVIVGEGSAAAKAALAVRQSLELDVVTLVEEKRDAHNLLDHIEALTRETLKKQ